MLKLVDFGRFMMQEDTEKSILAFTSKTGQCVAHNRHRIFLFGFFLSERGYIKTFYMPYFKLQILSILEIELKKEYFLASFHRFLLHSTSSSARQR